MKSTITLLLLILCLSSKAQVYEGIKFEKGLSWVQLKEKAKAENKYIFLDAYTTWCVPCKKMDKEIFTQKKVGDFFNENFINVKVQMDSTKNDNDEIKRWYDDARAISDQYNIDSYPTYLFFNPQGELVQRFNGATNTADEFINQAAAAKGVYIVQKLSFEKGERDPNSLLALLKTSQLMNDRELIPQVANAYLLTQSNLLTEDNIKLISIATKRTDDPGFSILLSNPNDIDEVLGSGYSKKQITTILFDEIALPYLRIDASVKNNGGGMIFHGGKLRDSVNWLALKKELDLKYPASAKLVILEAKIHYYKSYPDWNKYIKTVNENKIIIDNESLVKHARAIFLQCNDVSQLKEALKWCDELIKKKKNNPDYIVTYADLLYKSGQKEKSIKVYEDLIKSHGDFYGRLPKIVQKMKNGEKTW
jgi:thioredoxin-related protein/disulfide oxidoreductase YuzD